MIPEYVKCIYDIGGAASRFTVNKVYKNQDIHLEHLYLIPDKPLEISHLYDYPLSGSNWKFVVATEIEYNL